MKLTPEQHFAMQFFVRANGKLWKKKLRVIWETEKFHPDRALLQQVRNLGGPAWLSAAKTSDFI